MGSSGSVPWYARPPRDFPAKRWLRQRYPFRVSFAPFRLLTARPAGWATSPPRDFPAWVRWNQQAGDYQ